MARGHLGAVAQHLGRLFGAGTVNGLDEPELLHRFVTRRDPVALEALVTRHGPMVLGVCRRVLGNSHEAEDAFQATFLVLVKRAATIRDPSLMGPWLYGVAHRVAVRARANAAKRRAREHSIAQETAMAKEETAVFDRAELRAVLDDELARLPERFRRPIVLCYLEGLTHDEAASRLRCPVGTVRSRLSTARAKLRTRLSKRGITVPAATLATAMTVELASAAVPIVLLDATLSAATAFAASGSAAAIAGMVSASAASLAEGVATTMMITKIKVIGGMMLAGALTMGVGGATATTYWQDDAKGTGPQKGISPEEAKASVQRKLDDQRSLIKAYADSMRAAVDEVNAAEKSLQQAQEKLARLRNASKKMGDADQGGGGFGAGFGGGRVGFPAGEGLGGGMGGGGMGGGAYAPQGLVALSTADLVVVHKPQSRQVHVNSTESGRWSTYTIPEGIEVIPIVSAGLIALHAKGDEIRQIATYVSKSGEWYPIDLKVPASKYATPLVSQVIAVYAIGNYVYAFSEISGTWDVLELEDGAKPVPVVEMKRVRVEHQDRLYLFNASTGKWTGLDAETGKAIVPAEK